VRDEALARDRSAAHDAPELADASGELTGHITGHAFGASASGVSFGFVDTSTRPRLAPQVRRTFGADDPATVEAFRSGRGAENAGPRVGDVVIHEIHYHPAVGTEFLELHNRSGADVSLFEPGLERGWRIDSWGEAGHLEALGYIRL